MCLKLKKIQEKGKPKIKSNKGQEDQWKEKENIS